jgi:hypothetical protein
LPLLVKSGIGAGANESNVGKIANKGDFENVVSDVSHMTSDEDLAAKVGGKGLPSRPDARVLDMFVVGDSVFACIAGNRSSNSDESGYRSGAVFGVFCRCEAAGAGHRSHSAI